MNFNLAFTFVLAHVSLFALVIFLSYQSIRTFTSLGGFTSTSIQRPQPFIDAGGKQNGRISKQNKDFICRDRDVINYIQRDQWLKAATDMFGEAVVEMNDKDLGFYHENYGAIKLSLTEKNKKNASSLIYYRIAKSGNDIIRSLLYEYAFAMTGESDKFELNHCSIEPCAHSLVELLPSKKLLSTLTIPTPGSQRYAFTIVREPISRFIAALSEIEGKAFSKGSSKQLVSLKYPLGSINRFMEYVKLLLYAGGSKLFFKQYEEYDIRLLAPMIGTLQVATQIEGAPNTMHVYHYEDMKQAMIQIGRELGIKKFETIMTNRKISTNPPDTTNLTYAAVTFLSLAGRDALQRFGGQRALRNRQLLLSLPDGHNITSMRPLARQYIQTLCRVYLVDYICGDYDLPLDCFPLLDEVESILVEILHNIDCANSLDKCNDKDNLHYLIHR